MFQNTKISFFTFIELINIMFEFISKSNLKSLLLHLIKIIIFSNIFFYIDNIFENHKFFEKQYRFLKNHFFFKILWIYIKSSLFKLQIKIIKFKTFD